MTGRRGIRRSSAILASPGRQLRRRAAFCLATIAAVTASVLVLPNSFADPPGSFSASASAFSVRDTAVNAQCSTTIVSGPWEATLTARDTNGDLITDLDTSLIQFAASTPDVTVSAPVINNGDGTYSVTLTGPWPSASATVSVTVDGSAKVADATGVTDVPVWFGIALVDYSLSPGDFIFTLDHPLLAVGQTATLTLTYSPNSPCAPGVAQISVTGGGAIVSSSVPGSPAQPSATMGFTMTAGVTATVGVTSSTAGVVTVSAQVSGPFLVPWTDVPNSPVDITFFDSPVQVSSLAVSPSSVGLQVGEAASLAVLTAPWNTAQAVSWASGDPAVATVDANGRVTAVGAGSTTVVATANDGSGLTGSASVVVSLPAQPGGTPSAPAQTPSGAATTTAISVQTGGAPDTAWPSVWCTVAIVLGLGLLLAGLRRARLHAA